MIIWIDGTLGVGKTTVAWNIKEKLSESQIEIYDSDQYFQEHLKMIWKTIKKGFFPGIGGGFPQDNLQFLLNFRKLIEEKSKDKNKLVLVVMALTKRECKEEVFDYLNGVDKNIVHIILTASEETIRLRVLHDNKRNDKYTPLKDLKDNIAFLQSNFKDAQWLDTEGKNETNVADEIIKKFLNPL